MGSCASPEDDGVDSVFSNSKKNPDANSEVDSAIEPPKLGDVDLEKMIEIALKYNVMQLKSVQKMRRAIRLRKISEEKAAAKVFKKVQPLMALLREVGKI